MNNRFKDILKHLLFYIKHNKDNKGGFVTANLDSIKDILSLGLSLCSNIR